MNNYFIYLFIIVISIAGCFYNVDNDLTNNEIRLLNLEKQVKCPDGHKNNRLARYCATVDAPDCRKKILYTKIFIEKFN